MTREGVSTVLFDEDLAGDVDGLTVEGNDIVRCGLAPLSDAVAMGGGILVRDGSGIRILHNRIEDNGPPNGFSGQLAVGFGVAAITCFGVEVHGNTIVGNGPFSHPDREQAALNVGVAAIGVYGTVGGVGDSGLATAAVTQRTLVAGPAASIRDNVLTTPSGPGVLAYGLGPIAVNGNTIVSTYPGRSVLPFGRAVLVLNLGASPDIGLDPRNEVSWPLRHGRVQVHDNQITVQADASGLPEADPELQPFEADVGQLVTGSAVAAMSLDDVSFSGNQVLNEVSPPAEAVGRIRSSVWVRSTTARSTANRVTELPRTALLSYAGGGRVHNASDNTTTHCMRVEAISVVQRDNQELLCSRRRPDLDNFHFVVGGDR